MELSILVARIAATAYLAMAVALLRGEIKGKVLIESFEKSSGLRLLTGVIALIIGALLIQHHNFWVKDWTVLITIIAWASFIKGVVYIAFPKSLFNVAKKLMATEKYLGILGGLLNFSCLLPRLQYLL